MRYSTYNAENAGQKIYDVTHKLLFKGKGCDEIAFFKICNASYSLLVIGKGVMMIRLPFTKCAMSHSQTVGHRKRCDETTSQNAQCVTHRLLVIGKDVMRLPFTNVPFHSQTVGHSKNAMRLPFTKHTMSLTSY